MILLPAMSIDHHRHRPISVVHDTTMHLRLYPSSLMRYRRILSFSSSPSIDSHARSISIVSLMMAITIFCTVALLQQQILPAVGLHVASSYRIHHHHTGYQRRYHQHFTRPTIRSFSRRSKMLESAASSKSVPSPRIDTSKELLQEISLKDQIKSSDQLHLSSSLLDSSEAPTQPVDQSIPEQQVDTSISTKRKHIRRKPRRPHSRRRSVVSAQPSDVHKFNDIKSEYIEETKVNNSVALPTPSLDISYYILDLRSAARDDPSKAHEVLNRLHVEYGNTLPPFEIVTCYATVMNAYIQVGKLHNAESILAKMEHHFAENKIASPIPSSTTTILDQMYVSMAQAWADDCWNDYSGTSADHAEGILRRIMSTVEHAIDENSINVRAISSSSTKSTGKISRSESTASFTISRNAVVKIWTIVVEGWSKRAGIVKRAMLRADELLHEMETHEHPFIHPNIFVYTSVICALSRCKQNDMARRAEDLLEEMKQNNVEPDMVAYVAVIDCWAKAVSRRERSIAAKRAIGLLNEMERLYVTKKVYNVKPSTLTYIAVINAIGNCIDPDCSLLAEGILQRMRHLHESGTIVNVKPNTAAYNAVIFALGRAPVSKRNPTALRAEKLFDDMTQRAAQGERDVQPDVRTWAFLLRAWSRCKQPDAAEQAQRILDNMEYLYEKGLSQVRPNFVCYTTVMGAWGYSRSNDALDNMERILKRMEDQYSETLEPDVRPNTVSYVTCIDAFVGRNEPDAAQRAQATVDRMMQLYAKGLGHVRPTRPVFDVLIQAWSRSKEKHAAQNAEKIFHWMENQYEQGGDTLVRPNGITLCAVLNAWANQAESGGAARALQIWEHTNSVATQVDREFRPTIAMANIVIKAIARSKDPDAVMKAERVLLKLEDDYRSGQSFVRPDVTTYSSVINACAYCVGNAAKRTEALQTALRTFYKLYNMEDERANNITYGTMLKAIQNLMPISEERIELVRQIFDMCCEDGCVDYFVLSQVRFASPQLYRDLVEGPCGLGGPGLKYGLDAVLKNVPTEWTSNTLD